METDEDIEALLDAAAERDEQIATLVNAGWSYSRICQALEVTPGVVSGVMKRQREKHRRVA